MRQLFTAFRNDEAGFVISAELVLVLTIGVLGMVVGLSEVAWSVNQELNDVGAAIGSINQSFHFSGQRSCRCVNAWVPGSCFQDNEPDDCDHAADIMPAGAQGHG
jgi:Flp pilus assembly pilin Flp